MPPTFNSSDPKNQVTGGPAPGCVIFYPECRPALVAGAYKVQLQQKIQRTDGASIDADTPAGEADKKLPAAQSFPFEVTGPRFALGPDEVHSVYPPANAGGSFETRLPLIVLGRRTLPWERTISGTRPWMALLLFEEAEVTELPSATVGTILAPATKAKNPYLSPVALTAAEAAMPCLGVEVTLETFTAVAPYLEELPDLTHVRQVNTADKELLGQDEDGWFSVVIGNRLPRGGGTKYVACLVSLEGHVGHLPTDVFGAHNAQDMAYGGSPNPKTTKVQLVTLARWKFTCEGKGDFQSIMTALPGRGGVELLGAPPRQLSAAEARKSKLAHVIMSEFGHLQVGHTTREGETTVAWYRGPLVPLKVQYAPSGPYHTSDQARTIDPESGLENLGHAAAFEVGRLLALSDSEFALDLLRWRRGDYNLVHTSVDKKGYPPNPGSGMTWEEIARFDPMGPIVIQELLYDCSRTIVDRTSVLAQLGDPTGLAGVKGKMAGLNPVSVAQTFNLDITLVGKLLDNKVLDGNISLETIGVRELPTLQTSFDVLVGAQGLGELQHLGVARVGAINLKARGGFG